MKPVINTNLFRHTSSGTESLNNLCTIVHQFKVAGIYQGTVFIKEQLLGEFKVKFDPKIEVPQINLDLSAFDPFYSQLAERNDFKFMLEVGMEGYLLFFTSGHHDGMYVKMKQLSENKDVDYYDSRHPVAGDMIMFRTIHPGSYSITDKPGNAQFYFSIPINKEGKYAHPSKLQPLNIVLNVNGFEPAQMEVQPLQAIVITTKINCSLTLKMDEEKKYKQYGKKGEKKKKEEKGE